MVMTCFVNDIECRENCFFVLFMQLKTTTITSTNEGMHLVDWDYQLYRLRMLAYGLPADVTNEYIKIGESTTIESMKRFCRAIVEIFAEQYLRKPTANDVARLLYVGKQRGFSGMLGSLDCMHWK